MRPIDADELEKEISSQFPQPGMWMLEGNDPRSVIVETLVDVLQTINDSPTITHSPEYDWTQVSDHNPEIDMSYAHSKPYLVKYKGGGYDVAFFSNCNRFYSGHVTEHVYWNCGQYCEVEAWMPIPKYIPPKENEDE